MNGPLLKFIPLTNRFSALFIHCLLKLNGGERYYFRVIETIASLRLNWIVETSCRFLSSVFQSIQD